MPRHSDDTLAEELRLAWQAMLGREGVV